MLQSMRRVNVHLDTELDAELAAEAARRGQSKASLLREAARAFLDRSPQGGSWDEFTGAITDAAADDRHHDEIIYGS